MGDWQTDYLNTLSNPIGAVISSINNTFIDAMPDLAHAFQAGSELLVPDDNPEVLRIEDLRHQVATMWPIGLELYVPSAANPVVRQALTVGQQVLSELAPLLQRYGNSDGWGEQAQNAANGITRAVTALQSDQGLLNVNNNDQQVKLPDLRLHVLKLMIAAKQAVRFIQYAALNDTFSWMPDILYGIVSGLVAMVQLLINLAGQIPNAINFLTQYGVYLVAGGAGYLVYKWFIKK